MIKYYLEKLKLRFFDGFIRHFSEKEIGREKKKPWNYEPYVDLVVR